MSFACASLLYAVVFNAQGSQIFWTECVKENFLNNFYSDSASKEAQPPKY